MREVGSLLLYVLVTAILLTLATLQFLFDLVLAGVRRLMSLPRAVTIPLALAVIVLLGLVAVAGWGYYGTRNLAGETVTIMIETGTPFSRVADALVERGVVNSRLALDVAARLRKIDRQLTVGRYDFGGENSVYSVLNRLESADFYTVRITVWEGLPIWRTAGLLGTSLRVDSADIMAAANDSGLLEELRLPYLEGYLYPETYYFPWHIGAKDIVRTMVAMHRSELSGINLSNAPNGLAPDEVITMASIIEAEAFLDAEKPVIASVYHNRLTEGWRLDADPTVIYGLGGLDRPLYRRDIRKDGPYNTYRRRGLPPTPINSPGKAAVLAALQPDTTDFMFFVADGTGGHRFSRTLGDHNRAIREIRRQRTTDGS